MGWLTEDRAGIAAERILDAAGRLFAEDGVAGTGMDAVAREAGCSRATLYRYFESRQALHIAFAHREARRIVEKVARDVADEKDPDRRNIAAILAVIDEVRSAPHLAAWFGPADSALLSTILADSPIIDAFTSSFAGGDPELGRWVLRVILSFIAVPGRDTDEERRLVESYVGPLIPARTGGVR